MVARPPAPAFGASDDLGDGLDLGGLVLLLGDAYSGSVNSIWMLRIMFPSGDLTRGSNVCVHVHCQT